MTSFAGFPKDTLRFLDDLQHNNNRDWFAANKQRYEQSFLQPALALIAALEKPLAKVAPLLRVEAKTMGGSLMRIYKDTRFSKDKTPYKTNMGIQFRHLAGKDVHAPGVYLHIAPDECFLGAGIWRPPSEPLTQIRHDIAENEAKWRRVFNHKRFRESFQLYEDRLKTTPRGFDKEHAMIDHLRQRSYLGTTPLTRELIESPDLVTRLPQLVAAARPLMVALCEVLEQPY